MNRAYVVVASVVLVFAFLLLVGRDSFTITGGTAVDLCAAKCIDSQAVVECEQAVSASWVFCTGQVRSCESADKSATESCLAGRASDLSACKRSCSGSGCSECLSLYQSGLAVCDQEHSARAVGCDELFNSCVSLRDSGSDSCSKLRLDCGVRLGCWS